MATNGNSIVFDSDKHVVFTHINQWENHSIAKIRLNAEQMRNEVRAILAKGREIFGNLLNQINTRIETKPDALYNYLNQWTTQLTHLREEFLNLSSSIRLEQDTNNVSIRLLKVSYGSKKNQPINQNKNEDPIEIPGTKTLTRSMLRDLSVTERKQVLGERLFVLVQQIEPTLAAKITGMFLEWDSKYILMLIVSPVILATKIREAKYVLEAHAQRQRFVTQS